MYIINGIAYANEFKKDIEVTDVKPLDDMMIVSFSTGESRLFDASLLLGQPAFEPLKDEKIFKGAKVEYGIVVWNDGEIDVAPEMIYKNSYAYEPLEYRGEAG